MKFINLMKNIYFMNKNIFDYLNYLFIFEYDKLFNFLLVMVGSLIK